jgi:hypothetical protein
MKRPAYKLIDTIPMRCSTEEALAAWSDPGRRIAHNQFGNCYVSTVFLPLPPCDSSGEPVALFETLVFDAEHQVMAKTWALTHAHALVQHDKGVAKARRSRRPMRLGLLMRTLPPLGLAA